MSTYNPNAIIPSSGSSASTTSATSLNGVQIQVSTEKSGLLGKDDFLKLLVGQLQNQDPMQPTGNDEFIQQMTSFSQLEQQTNTASSTNSISSQLAQTSALSLIGKTVTYQDSGGDPQTGKVEQVDIGSDGKATLTVGDQTGVPIGKVTQVK
jgi:flagellar basal-body rod modification protein FlgD